MASLSPTSKIEDSLDNLSNTKLRQQSQEKHRTQLIHTKQKFVSFLEKLQSPQTRQVSLNQLKKLIQKNNQSEHLRIYLSILKSIRPNTNSTTKEHEILVISIITQVFKANLIDPIDKQPGLLKTCFKVIQILLGFFNDNSGTVQQACARVILDLNNYCLVESNCQKQQKLSIIWTPLISILKNGVDKASQATATVCINQLVKLWTANGQQEILQMVSRDIFQVILKLNSEYHDIFMTVLLLLDHKGLIFFENKLPNFISKVLAIVNGTRQTANSFNSYMCRVNVCKIIQKIATLLSAEQRDRLVDLNVIGSLEKAARNKIIQVQMSATRALRAWKGQPIPEEKRPVSQGRPIKTLEQMRNEKKRQRSSSKEQKIKIQSELNFMKQDLQKMVRGGWGANNRAKNYVKRGQGVGGGHYGDIQSSTPPKNNKSHKEHLQQLRDVIKRGTKQNKDFDRFQQVETIYKMSKQVPTNSNNGINQNQKSQSSSKQIAREKPKNIKNLDNYNEGQQDDFMIVQQSGEQMVSFKPNQKQQPNNNAQRKNLGQRNQPTPSPSSIKSNNPDNVFIGAEQAKELLDHQKSLLQEFQNSKQIDFYSEAKPKIQSILKNSNNEAKSKLQPTPLPNLDAFKKPHNSPKQNNLVKVPNKPETPIQKKSSTKVPQNNRTEQISKVDNKVQNKQYIQKAIQNYKQIQQQMPKTKDSRIKSKMMSQFAPMISEQELQELMIQNNLSEVSQNLDNILNESDFQIVQQSGDQSQSYDKRFAKNSNNGSMQFNQSKKSGRLEDSLNFTQSKVSKFKQSNINNRKQSPLKNKSQSGDVYNYDQRASNQQQQFTLNPNVDSSSSKKFQSIYQNPNQVQQEVEEELAASYFQESRKGDQMLPLKTNVKSPFLKQAYNIGNSRNNNNNHDIRHVQNDENEDFQQISKNYQQLIQNPPNVQKHFDKKSNFNKSFHSDIKQSNLVENQQIQQEQSVSITDNWIKILGLIENDQLNQAFQQAYLLDDPIYLIRLLIITKTPISSLTAQNCQKLWQKFLDVYKHNFISILTVQLFTEAHDLNLIKSSLTIQEMHDLLMKLYQVSGTTKGKLSFNAALLYNNIDTCLKPKQQKNK